MPEGPAGRKQDGSAFWRPWASLLLSAIVAWSSLSPGLNMAERRDPKSGKIRLLNIGADAIPGTASPLVVLFSDPLISQQAVPLYSSIFDMETTRRFMRVYMPRSKSTLVSDFDLILISDATVDNFPSKYFPWMVSAVREDGLGMLTTGGSAMYGGKGMYPSWDKATIAEVFSVTFEPNDFYDVRVLGKPPIPIVPVDRDNEFVSSLPWKTAPPINYLIHRVQARLGANVLLEAGLPQKYPLLVYWDVGEGRCTNLIFDWYPWRIEPFQEWSYYIDFATNLIYFSAGIRVPQDLETVHRYRFLLSTYLDKRTVLLSLLNFVESFGANTNVVEAAIAKVDRDYAKAQQLYREQRWDEGLQLLKQVHSSLSSLEQRAIELKQRALFWIYLTEWLAVTAVLLLSGFVLWTLMIRRKLYGEVRSTRLRQADQA